MASPPLLNPSKLDEEISLYLAVSPTVVSLDLIQKKDHMQSPVCYTSQVLRGAKERYLPMKKLAFTLIRVACKHRPYFQAHTIIV